MLITAGLFIISAIFLPIWRIELDAPQYPEGLGLYIYASKLGGDVDIINGLNHYIGMKTLHSEEFVEFKVLPFIIGFFGIWSILAAFLKSRKILTVLLIAFLLFGILAMYDFWKWEYDYGHDLDPTAAIQIPGMAYQPPLIGFKQLLNFGAYSIPDIGGWLMLAGGLLIAWAWAVETRLTRKLFSRQKARALSIPVLFLSIISCQPSGPDPIIINKDTCSFCKMSIADPHFGCELITMKGRIYKFDDISCMTGFIRQNTDKPVKKCYVHDFNGTNSLIPAETAFYIKGGSISSPMSGNVAAFSTASEAESMLQKTNAQKTEWSIILSK